MASGAEPAARSGKQENSVSNGCRFLAYLDTFLVLGVAFGALDLLGTAVWSDGAFDMSWSGIRKCCVYSLAYWSLFNCESIQSDLTSRLLAGVLQSIPAPFLTFDRHLTFHGSL